MIQTKDSFDIAKHFEITKLDELLIDKLTGEQDTWFTFDHIHKCDAAIRRCYGKEESEEIYVKLCKKIADFN